MVQLFNKYGRAVLLGIGAVASIALVLMLMLGNTEGGSSAGLIVSYWLFFVCIGLAVLLPLFFAITEDPKSLMRPLLSVGILGGLFLLCWLMAGSDVPAKFGPESDFGITNSGYKLVGGSIIMTWVMLFAVLGSIIAGTVYKIFK